MRHPEQLVHRLVEIPVLDHADRPGGGEVVAVEPDRDEEVVVDRAQGETVVGDRLADQRVQRLGGEHGLGERLVHEGGVVALGRGGEAVEGELPEAAQAEHAGGEPGRALTGGGEGGVERRPGGLEGGAGLPVGVGELRLDPRRRGRSSPGWLLGMDGIGPGEQDERTPAWIAGRRGSAMA